MNLRHYECECSICHRKSQVAFHEEPYPKYGSTFEAHCKHCERITEHTRVLTKKTAAEIRNRETEERLRQALADKCRDYQFDYRFVYQSIVVTTALSDWSFDYHRPRITLYHESTVKINFTTGNYAKSHVQFRDKKMKPEEVIDYIAAHDKAGSISDCHD